MISSTLRICIINPHHRVKVIARTYLVAKKNDNPKKTNKEITVENNIIIKIFVGAITRNINKVVAKHKMNDSIFLFSLDINLLRRDIY